MIILRLISCHSCESSSLYPPSFRKGGLGGFDIRFKNPPVSPFMKGGIDSRFHGNDRAGSV